MKQANKTAWKLTDSVKYKFVPGNRCPSLSVPQTNAV